MKIINKTIASLIALFLMLTIVASSIMPIANAHTPAWNYDTWTYIAVSPNPVGLGQSCLVVWWLDQLPQTASGEYGDRFTYTVEITKPDNSIQTLGPYKSDPVGGGWINYTPDQIGNYTFVAKFPGLTYTGQPFPPGGMLASRAVFIGDVLNPSTSDPVTLAVQQDPITSVGGSPLPEDYWTRPIHALNREWYQIAGNWLKGGHPDGNLNPNSKAPSTAHVVWTKPTTFGGIVGDFGDISYHTGSAYESFWTAGSGTIINGKLYYNEPKAPRYGWYCVDLRTGEQIFFRNSTGPIQIGSQTGAHIGNTNIPWMYPRIDFGQTFNYDSGNQHGARSYLWSIYTTPAASTYSYSMLNGSLYSFTAAKGTTMWQMYDAVTGNWICNIANIPSGTMERGPNGELLIYTYNSNGWLTLWNSSVALGWPNNNLNVPFIPDDPRGGGSSEAYYWMWREPIGLTVDGRNGYSWNVTAPKSLGSINQIVNDDKSNPDRLIGTNGFSSYGMMAYSIWALNLKVGQQGQQLWKQDYAQPPIKNSTLRMGGASLEDGIFTLNCKNTRQWYGYDLDTGALVWGPTDSQPAYDMYGMGTDIAYGKLFSGGYGGIVHAYDVKTGELLWASPTNELGLEGPYPNDPATGTYFFADGKVYLFSGEHSHTQPLLRGWHMYCFDVETGKNLWNFTGLWASISIADGYLVNFDHMDNQIYCFGKGQTATTVSASPDVSVYGSTVLIKGTVTDQSPGAKDTPAIADEDMTDWMEYIYHKQPMPTNAKGVTVNIDVIDANGNYRPIGVTTSDTDGFYSFDWTPDIEGKYTVIANFEGSESYWPSHAETAFVVEAAAPTPTAQPAVALPPTDMYVLGIGVAIIIAIAIVGAILFMAIKRRP